jgi:thioredoxin-related protein
MRRALILSFVISIAIVITSFSSKPPKKGKIVWLSFKELQTAYKMQRRPILVDVYTDWCGWCKRMDADTYSDDKVIDYINKNFYAVKYNAEKFDSVTLGGKKYGFNNMTGVHDLTNFLLSGRLGYPTTVFLTSINSQPTSIPGYMQPKQMEPTLKYFGDGNYRKVEYADYIKGFSGTW